MYCFVSKAFYNQLSNVSLMKLQRIKEDKLNHFIEGFISAKIMCPQLTPLLALDTTAVPALKQIQKDTTDDYSTDGRILYQTSSKLLDVFSKTQTDHNKKPTKDQFFSIKHVEYNNHQISRPVQRRSIINLARKQMKSQSSNSKSRKSVSPKHENKRPHPLSNISAISKNYQTQTDHSFEIDLFGMGLLPQGTRNEAKQSPNAYLIESDYSSRGSKPRKSKENQVYIVSAREKSQTKIREEEPWECDQQEIQEEIRQLDQKLRHRALTQRTKVESEFKRNQRNR